MQHRSIGPANETIRAPPLTIGNMTREKRFHEQFVKEVAERLGVPPDQMAGPLSVYEGIEPDSLEV